MEPIRVRSHRPALERRAQILEAALRCFAEKGFHRATMDDLVQASGLSKGSLYWHFEGKQDVFLALFDDFAEAIFADWEELMSEGRATLDVLDAVVSRSFDRLGSGAVLAAWAEFVAHPLARARLAGVYRQVREKLAQSLTRDVERGSSCCGPVDGVAAALTAATEGLLLQAMVDEDFDVRAHWRHTLALLRRGIAS